jgi:hypothetical protein
VAALRQSGQQGGAHLAGASEHRRLHAVLLSSPGDIFSFETHARYHHITAPARCHTGGPRGSGNIPCWRRIVVFPRPTRYDDALEIRMIQRPIAMCNSRSAYDELSDAVPGELAEEPAAEVYHVR